MGRDRVVRQIAGSNHVRQRVPAQPARTQALRQMYLDEVAMLAPELRERVERLHNSRALRPTAAHSARERHHRDAAFGKRAKSRLAMASVVDIGLGVFDLAR